MLLGLLLATTYFAFHAVYGTHGLQAKGKLIERSIEIEREVALLEAVRSRLHQDVAALSAEPPMPDIVQEHARSVLGFVRAGDLVVLQPRRVQAARP